MVLNALPIPWTAATIELFFGFPYVLLLWSTGLRKTPKVPFTRASLIPSPALAASVRLPPPGVRRFRSIAAVTPFVTPSPVPASSPRAAAASSPRRSREQRKLTAPPLFSPSSVVREQRQRCSRELRERCPRERAAAAAARKLSLGNIKTLSSQGFFLAATHVAGVISFGAGAISFTHILKVRQLLFSLLN
jgi:hypothetical protein